MNYKELLEKAREIYESEDTPHVFKAWLLANIICPANMSIEYDVKRRSTTQVFEYARSLDACNQHCRANIDKLITCLEKQGEHKPIVDFKASDWYVSKVDGKIHNMCYSVDKVEPKFHEGEWLCENKPNNYARFIQILGIVNVQGKERYRISRDIHNDEDIVEFGFVEKYYHKFTIQDAKDGDVLVAQPLKGSKSNEQIFLFKAINSRYCVDNCIEYYFRLCDGVFYENTTGYMGTTLDIFYPATKEQRGLLFEKMKEAGYEWNTDKKEVKKIEPKTLNADEVIEWFRVNWWDNHIGNPIDKFRKDFGL